MKKVATLFILSGFLYGVSSGLEKDDYLIRTLTTQNSKKSLNHNKIMEIQKTKIDQELLKLLVSTFIANGDLESAYEMIKKALDIFKDNQYWLEMYAKVSLWTGRQADTLDAYKRLAELSPTKENIVNLFKMALATNNFNVASEMLSRYPWLSNELKDLNELIYIFTQSGNLNQLVDILKEKYSQEKNPVYLYHLAYLSYNYGDMKSALGYMKTLEKEERLGLKEINLYGNILYALKKPKEAFDVYKKGMVLLKDIDAKSIDDSRELIEYFENLSDLGWFIKDFEVATYASEKLEAMGKGRFVDYVRLYLYQYHKGNYKKASIYAEKGYSKFKDDYLLTAYINSLNILKEWKKLLDVFSKLEENKIYTNPYLVSLYAKALYKTSNKSEAKNVLIKALRDHFSQEVLSEAIFYSIESSDQQFAKFIVDKYGRYKHKLHQQFAILFLFLQNSKESLALLKNVNKDNLEDYLFYSDVLYTYGKTEEALKIKFDIYKNLTERKTQTYQNPQLLELYIKVGMEFLPAYRMRELLELAKSTLQPEVYEDIYHSYLLRENYQDRLWYIMNIHKRTLRPWMYLNLALWMDDRFWQEELLEKYADVLPIRDRVEAFRRTGQIKNAFEYGYRGLEENREDDLMYKQFRDLVYTYSNRVENTVSYVKWDKIDTIKENLLIKHYLSEGIFISYESLNFFNQKNDSIAYKNLKNIHYQQLKYSKFLDTGFVEFGISLLDATNSTGGLMFRYNRYLGNKTTGELFVGKNQLSYESLYLFYGGMKDIYNFSINHSLNNRSSVFFSVIHEIYKSQDGKNLGSGDTLYMEGFYKLRVGYPDYTFRVYLQSSVFDEKENDKGSINRISTVDNPDVLPKSYSLMGAGFLFGFDNRDNYVRVFRPFLSGDITLNSRTGLGYGLSGGFGGAIFRQDNLSVGFRYIKDFRGTTASFGDYFIKYLLFF